MKKIILTAVLMLFGLSANADANTDFAKRVGGYFYTSLAPHGTWIEIGFDSPVWRPTMIRKSWTPYRMGQWIYTDYGWYWDSYEDFGYITYHYGRWYYDDYYGWIWIPDYEWAPAWVDWRYDNDYIGWAPLSPYALFDISIGIYYNYDYQVSYNHWNYVKYNHFCDHNVYNYYVAPKYKYRVHNRTKMRTNYSYYDGRVRNDGVDFDRIRERSGRNIERRNIVSVNDPNDLRRDNITKTRDKEIRTYFANPDDISRDGLRDEKIEKKDRKSTLEISKVELGRERNLDRSKDIKIDENRQVIKNDREDKKIDSRKKTEDTRSETNNDLTRKKVNNDKKLQEKRETEKRNSEIEKRNNEQIKRNDEIKRNENLKKSEEKKRIEQTKKNEQIEIQKRQDSEVQKRNEVTIKNREEKKSNTDVFKQNERRVEQKKETQKVEQRNQNNTRNTEVKRNDSNNRTTNTNTRTSETDNRDKSR